MTIALDVASGMCWSIVYLVAIIKGFQSKTWCIPKLAICQNLSWELYIVISGITNNSYGTGFFVQLIWLILDIGVLLTWLLYDRDGKYAMLRKLGILLCVSVVMLFPTYILSLWELTAFAINLIMSAAFIIRFRNGGIHWRSKVIAVAKLIGTFAATILNGVIFDNKMVLWLGGLCLILDSHYCASLMSNSSIGGGKDEKNSIT